jgi:hypothetical protein
MARTDAVMTPRGGTRTAAPGGGARRCCGSAAPGWRSRCRRHRPARTGARRAVRRRSGWAIFPEFCSGDPRYYATSTHSLQHTCRRGGLSRLERAKGFEPSTPTLARLCSTPELRPHPDRHWPAAPPMPNGDAECNRDRVGAESSFRLKLTREFAGRLPGDTVSGAFGVSPRRSPAPRACRRV